MKKLFFYAAVCSAALFSACSDDDKPDNGLDGNDLGVKASEITGIPASANIANVKLMVWDWDNSTLATLVTAKWESGFTIAFPETLASKYLRPVEDILGWDEEDQKDIKENGGTVDQYFSNKNVKVSDTDTSVTAFDAAGDYLGDFFIGKTDQSVTSLYMYADGDCKISGKVGDDEEMTTYNIDLKKGWNMIYGTTTKSGKLTQRSITSARPSGTGWVFGKLDYDEDDNNPEPPVSGQE